MVVRAKFMCTGVEKVVRYNDPTQFLYSAKFNAVSQGSEENKKFWEFTPSGNITLTSVLHDAFEPGQEYYVDFELAAVPA